MVWCRFTSNKFIGPYLLHDTMNDSQTINRFTSFRTKCHSSCFKTGVTFQTPCTFKNKLNEEHCEPKPSDQVSNTQIDCFISTFIEGLTKNMNRSKYCYEYNASMRRFASSVYALGGRNIYQFLQLNLPGAFPTIPTLDSYNKELCKRFQEGEFRFQELENYSNTINC
ncbi:unnamed protein product [Rotaria magnacalcarata]|uniref:Uncharacterized protein n=1 Tax=Rotaria magnacalcarata TaxID=392030 RepID=A0A815XAC8_9BILA|nr:unnamed protein product [Rotaria magnacalcarata]